MNTMQPRKQFVEELVSQAIQQAVDRSAEGNPELPPALEVWLAQLRLLYGVPFEYLIPDVRLLPTESLRFFYLDRNWTDLLVDGALSIGLNSSWDSLHTQTMIASIQRNLDQHETRVRSQLLHQPTPAQTIAGGTISGLLLRSAVVSGWPGMEVQAFAGGTTLQILRMECLSADVLLCLFNGIPDKVEFVEPPEGLHFGLREQPGGTGLEVFLRGIGYGTFAAGMQIDTNQGKPPFTPLTATVTLRQGAKQPPGVIRIGDLAKTIANQLQDAQAMERGETLNAAQFAIQMIRGAGQQYFVSGVAADAALNLPLQGKE